MRNYVNVFVWNFSVYAAVAALVAAALSLCFFAPTPAFIAIAALSAPAVSFICQTKIGSARFNYLGGLICLVIFTELVESVSHHLAHAVLVGAFASVLVGMVRGGIKLYQHFHEAE